MKSIPWLFENLGYIKVWRWKTDHFVAEIRSDGRHSAYVVTDHHAGMLSNGQTASFLEAENSVKEIVGKAYPTRLGYRSLVGAAATTFRIYTGENKDFAPYEGMNVQVVAATKAKTNREFQGILQVVHHDIVLTQENGEKVKIPPSFIRSISKEHIRPHLRPAEKVAGNSSSRTVRAEYSSGCTGKPGFFPGTVEHPSTVGYCPVHRI